MMTWQVVPMTPFKAPNGSNNTISKTRGNTSQHRFNSWIHRTKSIRSNRKAFNLFRYSTNNHNSNSRLASSHLTIWTYIDNSLWSTPTSKTINQESAQFMVYKEPATTKALTKMRTKTSMIPMRLQKNQIRTPRNQTKDLTITLAMTPDTSNGHRVGHRLTLICNRRLLLNRIRTLCLSSRTQATRFLKEARSLTANSITR